jgi:hypothetical protein
MADNDQKVAERDGDATTNNRNAGDNQKDVETRGSARRGRGQSSERNARQRSSLDFYVSQPTSVLGGYMEENTTRPEPFYQYGTIDTSGTGGGTPDMSEVSPVFLEARANALVTAARALDPSDPSVPRELVTLPGDADNRDEAKDTLLGAAQDAVENPIEVGGLTPAQREAAEEYDDSEGGRASLGGQSEGTDEGKRHDQKRSARDLDGDGADDRQELKQDAAEAKAGATQGSSGRREAASTQQGAQQAKGR